jgi:glycosyltransferase involved in cell wall biosynthesis
MKVAVFSVSYPPLVSGVSTIASSLAQAMSKKHQVSVFTANNKLRFETIKTKNTTEYRLPAIKFPVRKNLFVPAPNILKILKIINQIKPNLIHIHDPSYLGKIALIASIQQNIPIIATHHFIPAFITSYFENVLKSQPIINTVEKQIWKSVVKLYNQIDHIVVPSSTFKNILLKNQIIPPISIISNGVDLKKFHPQTKPNQSKKYLLYLGRLDKDKNLEILLRAYSKSNHQNQLHLILAGEGKQRNSLQQLAKKLNIDHLCLFPGYISEAQLPSLYQNAYAFIITSKVEAQSITTLQAAACGLPIVAARAAALPELVFHKKNGLLISPDKQSDITLAINYLIAHPQQAKKFAQNSLKIARQHNQQITFKQYEKLYYQLINR